MKLETRQVGPWEMNTYALICPETNQSVLIDPGDDPEILQEMLGDSQPVAILLTHTHVDHIGALPDMRQALGVPVLGNDGPHEPGGKDIEADRWLRDGDTVTVGEHTLRAVYAPGHIGDQICFVLQGDHRVIVGDTIFDGGPGRTWSAEGFKTTLQTLRNVVLPWPDDTVCYPGHGPHFRLGDRRAQIEAFLVKDHGDFFGDATWEM
ncbi:MAG: MBL fold metallo-hydrolase [Anaerolineaceae bacterium]|nr:MBL fold metallo-hydrolase [Anaerolineaceae bacterium]